MSERSLTPTMERAINFAKGNDGKLIRHPGGFWQGPMFSRWGESFGTSTVEALVKRELADYTDWFTNKAGRKFPIEATLRRFGE